MTVGVVCIFLSNFVFFYVKSACLKSETRLKRRLVKSVQNEKKRGEKKIEFKYAEAKEYDYVKMEISGSLYYIFFFF